MIKVIFLDIDNTLLDFKECSKETIKFLLKKYNVEYYDEIFDVFYEINNKLWCEIEKGTLTKPELHKIRWKMALEKLGINIDGIKFEKEFVENLRNFAIPVTHAKEFLEYLSKKYYICAVSNAYHEQQVIRLKNAHMSKHIKKLYTSELLNCQKPTKEFFDGCFDDLRKTMDIDKNEVIMIGDSLTADITGGIEYGLKTCWFNFEKEPIPKNIKIDYIINDLSDIKNIL